MARTLGKQFILAGVVSVSGEADALAIAAAARVDSNNLVVHLDDDESVPRTLDEAEAITERAGRLSTSDRTKARALITAIRERESSR